MKILINVYVQSHFHFLLSIYCSSFDSLDKNSDGSIDFNEFLFYVAVTSRNANLDERLGLVFDLYVIEFFPNFSSIKSFTHWSRWDVSNDGQLDQNELAHLISAMVLFFLSIFRLNILWDI